MQKRILSAVLAAIILLGIFALASCTVKASKYTEAEHIQRVTKRIKAKYIDGDWVVIYKYKPTGFTVYPLYNENGELNYFLVEFEPYGFLYVHLAFERPFYVYLLGSSMYSVCYYLPWCRYTVDITNSQPEPDTDKIWELDENGEKVLHYRSPFFVAGTMEEKKYLLRKNDNSGYILAVKTGDKYFNLVSMEEFEYIDGNSLAVQAFQYISFHSGKYYDL